MRENPIRHLCNSRGEYRNSNLKGLETLNGALLFILIVSIVMLFTS